jgi:hypothetical protein
MCVNGSDNVLKTLYVLKHLIVRRIASIIR